MKHLWFALVLVPSLALADKTYDDAEASITHDCDKQGNATFNNAEGKITVTGKCKVIIINGGSLTGRIASVAQLTVNGSENELAVDVVEKLAVNGSDNKITYKGKPKVSVTGSGNKVAEKK